MSGMLTINVGGMFSGKTTELLRQGRRHTLAKEKVIYVKPNIDNRYSDTKVVSHNGEASDYTNSLVVSVEDVIYPLIPKDIDVVLIDEVQFFEKSIITDIYILLMDGKKVYCSGLDLSFNNKPFDITAELMAYADVVQKFKAVCSECGKDAYITAKKGHANADVIDVGSSDKYAPVCRECYHNHSIGGVVKYG